MAQQRPPIPPPMTAMSYLRSGLSSYFADILLDIRAGAVTKPLLKKGVANRIGQKGNECNSNLPCSRVYKRTAATLVGECPSMVCRFRRWTTTRSGKLFVGVIPSLWLRLSGCRPDANSPLPLTAILPTTWSDRMTELPPEIMVRRFHTQMSHL